MVVTLGRASGRTYGVPTWSGPKLDKHTMEITGGKTYAELDRDRPQP